MPLEFAHEPISMRRQSEVPSLATKRELLMDAGFVYSFDRDVYYNRETRKVFSVEFVDDHSVEELDRCIHEGTEGEDWRFYFNTPPSESVQRQLQGVLG